jgi:hypothetical protein
LGCSFGIIGVGGKPEAETRSVPFPSARVETDQARGLAEEQNQNAGGQRIECAEVPNLAKPGQMTYRIDDVVRRFPLRLIDDQCTVEGGRLWLAWHAAVFCFQLFVFIKKASLAMR